MRRRGLFLLVLCVTATLAPWCAAAADDAVAPPATTVYRANLSETELRAKYRELTKRILLAGIELERFSLRYRLHGIEHNKRVGYMYFGTQLAGASGALAFNIIGTAEFGKARHDPEKFSGKTMRKGANTGMIAAIVAAAGSAAALSYNGMVAQRHARDKLDTRQASKFVTERLQALDQMLAQRDALVAKYADHRMAAAARAETNVLHLMRDAFVIEFATFLHDVRRMRVDENMFYALNTFANIMAAISAHYLSKATREPHFWANTQILLTVAGGIATIAPVVSTTSGIMHGRHARDAFVRKAGGMPAPPTEKLTQELETVEALIKKFSAEGEQFPAALTRAALYSRSSANFAEELTREQRLMKYYNSVATQNDFVGPAIGGTVLTQGIIGTYAHYKFTGVDEMQKAGLDYAGSVVGTCGSAVAVVVTAGSMIFDILHMRHLEKQHKLPEQLIEERLKAMDEAERTIQSM